MNSLGIWTHEPASAWRVTSQFNGLGFLTSRTWFGYVKAIAQRGACQILNIFHISHASSSRRSWRLFSCRLISGHRFYIINMQVWWVLTVGWWPPCLGASVQCVVCRVTCCMQSLGAMTDLRLSSAATGDCVSLKVCVWLRYGCNTGACAFSWSYALNLFDNK